MPPMIHPAGQGYNLAVGDARGWLILSRNQLSGRDIGSRHGLRLYARKRLVETSAIAMTDGLNSLFLWWTCCFSR